LYELAQSNPASNLEMNRTILQAIANSDFANYLKIDLHGQTLTADFFAVYTAEQVRNLMDNSLTTQDWDIALLQMTMLGTFYSKMERPWVIYSDPYLGIKETYTDEVFDQYPGKSGIQLGNNDKVQQVTWQLRSARMMDWWQRSNQVDLDSKDLRGTRSGINMTRRQFEKMGLMITTWMNQNHPEITRPIRKSFGIPGDNFYKEIAEFFINHQSPDQYGPEIYEAIEHFMAFQTVVSEEGATIHQFIRKQMPKAKLPSAITIKRSDLEGRAKKRY
jgi:hypothetical protein